MRLLVIGRSGQVARALAQAGDDVVAIGRPEIDLTDGDSIARAIDRVAPGAIINAAAYTAVDKAESESELAMSINGAAPGIIAAIARDRALPFIHLSTDYVFSGASERPYREDDATGPINAYGRSKLAGEQAVLSTGGTSLIVRTCWVYAAQGQNFVNTMLRLAAEGRETVSVVADQRGCPTYAPDIASALIALSARADEWAQTSILHFANSGMVSWAEFAQAVFDEAVTRGLPFAAVEPIATSQYPTPARRPCLSALDTSLLAQRFHITPRPWPAGLADYFDARSQLFTRR